MDHKHGQNPILYRFGCPPPCQELSWARLLFRGVQEGDPEMIGVDEKAVLAWLSA